jgi:hypothetical protein
MLALLADGVTMPEKSADRLYQQGIRDLTVTRKRT